MKTTITSILTFLGLRQPTEKNSEKLISNSKLKMDINRGFQIEQPNIFVPWKIDEKTLTDLFNGKDLKHVTTGYYTMKCKSLDSLNCMIGFHFEPRKNGQLNELEFFRMNYDNQQKSFDEFQNSFTNAFGQPTSTTKGNEGFNNYQWRLDDVQIVHYVFDRFGPEEHMRIQKLK
jgi:hypothetical protein